MLIRFTCFLGVALVACAVGCSSSSSDKDAAGAAGSSPSGGAGTDSGGAPAGGDATSLSGTLGDLGKVKPTLSSLVINNSGERLVYLSTATITCDTLSVSRWLGSIDAGAQVVELVVKTTFKTGKVAVGKGAEVNYAKGGRSSSYEVSASSGSVTFTINDLMGPAEGTVEATYANPAGNVSGSFRAEFCDGGQGY